MHDSGYLLHGSSFIGAPIAASVSITLMSVLYAVYGLYFAPRTAWHPVTSQSFTCLPELFVMGIIGVGQSTGGWWSWEFMSLAVAQYVRVALAFYFRAYDRGLAGW